MYTLLNEFGKTVFANLCSTALILIISLTIKPPSRYEEEFNTYLKTKSVPEIKKGYNEYILKMKCRYIIYSIIFGIIFTFSLYYCVIFCNIYKKSSQGWVIGSVFSFIIDFVGIQIFGPFLITILRLIAKKNPDSKWVINLYAIVYFLKIFG